jgi:hypothetical protein
MAWGSKKFSYRKFSLNLIARDGTHAIHSTH